jgi:hypothetical protein
MPYISYYWILLIIKDTLSWNAPPCNLARNYWRSPYSQTWQFQMLNKNMIQWAKWTFYYCICLLSVIKKLRFFKNISIFQFFMIYQFWSWVYQGSKTRIPLRRICSKTFLLWYSFMIHKGYFCFPSLTKRTCSTRSPIYCPSVWLWEKKRYWIYVCLLHIKESVVTNTRFAAS